MSFHWLIPELKAMTGIPALTAFATAGFRASGVASVVTMPATLLSTAFCNRLPCSGPSLLAEYFRSMLSFCAAASAPLRMRSQKVSPGASWVTIAIVTRGVFTPPPPPPAPPVSAGFPPVLEQAASAAAVRSAPIANGRRLRRTDGASAPPSCGTERNFMVTPFRVASARAGKCSQCVVIGSSQMM